MTTTRKKMIVANWKMNHGVEDGLKFTAGLRVEIKRSPDAEVVICPAFTALFALGEALRDTPYKMGAQNMHWEESGAYTGEISPLFLREVEADYVLLGHSERRQYFGETNQTVNEKLKTALRYNLTPIVCIGETLEERQANKTNAILEAQIHEAVEGQITTDVARMIWAYEPRWAIGTGQNATPKQAEEAIGFIRDLLEQVFDKTTAQEMRILYGGSVSEENAAGFLKEKNIDGLLVGGASLDPVRFARIIQAAEQVRA